MMSTKPEQVQVTELTFDLIKELHRDVRDSSVCLNALISALQKEDPEASDTLGGFVSDLEDYLFEANVLAKHLLDIIY